MDSEDEFEEVKREEEPIGKFPDDDDDDDESDDPDDKDNDPNKEGATYESAEVALTQKPVIKETSKQ